MGTISQKLEYLNTTKGKIKDSINITGANIGANDTFRSYSTKLKDGIVDMINNGTDTAYNNFPKVTGTGSNITLNNTYNSKLKVDLKGNTYQASDPTPSSPQNIEVVTGYNEVKIEDEDGTNSQSYEINLGTSYNTDDFTYYSNNNSTYSKDGSTLTVTSSGTNSRVYYQFETVPNKEYKFTCSFTDTETAPKQVSVYEDSTELAKFSSSQTSGNIEFTFTPTQSTVIFRFLSNNTQNTSRTNTVVFSNISIKSNLLELCKIGTYQDYIYKENDKWYIHKEIGKVILDGSEEDWTKHSTTDGDLYMIYIPNAVGYGYNTGDTAPALCNSFKAKALGSFPDSTYGAFGISASSQARFFVGEPNSHYGTLSAWKQYLSNNNLIVYYGLTTPTVTILDDELQNQLNELESANSYLGQTNITAEYISGNQPFDMSVSALLKE